MKRVVILKADGLPGWLVERLVSARDPSTGDSSLPWIKHIFVERGVWVRNFYSRGVSLSAPAWSILDTGRPMAVRGNVEFDRYTLRTFDYLNFFPFYFKSGFAKAADMPAVELLDDLGIRLFSDRFEPEQAHRSFQLFQRGIRWETLTRAAGRPFSFASPRALLDEWQAGFGLSNSLQDEIERDLIRALADERILYLDLFTGEFDHTAHLDNAEVAQTAIAKRIDGLVGRIWSAIEKSPLAAHTLLVLVSDHGISTDPLTYSQGYNLVNLLSSGAGGGHHVVTNRHPESEYKLRGLDPFVHKVFTAGERSPYGASSVKDYPTALLDLDGNERAAIYLRNSELNVIHLLLLQLQRKDLTPSLRAAAAAACRRRIEHYAARSRPRIDRVKADLHDLREKITELTPAIQPAAGGLQARRMKARADSWSTDERSYREAFLELERLLSSTPDRSGASPKLVPRRMIGEPNTIDELQRYVVSIEPGGLQLAPDGTLDEIRSFRRINYFDFLTGITMRNVVQEGVSNRPVDFVAVRMPGAALSGVLPPEDAAEAGIWLSGGDDRQLLILLRNNPARIKVQPVARLREDAAGRVTFDRRSWREGLPLALFEDDRFGVVAEQREAWLAEWHSERDWLRASHRTRYSNAVIGLFEQFRDAGPADTGFHWTRRELMQADLLVFARAYWNFNVRGFNPGGNHGGFSRRSTHSVLMMAGGAETGMKRGLAIDEPYDALSFVPTLLKAMERCEPDLPGPVISDVTDSACPQRF